jgi:AraC-like DNA-binding protein
VSDFASLVSLANGLQLRWISAGDDRYPVSRRDVRRTTPFFHVIIIRSGRLRLRLHDARAVWIAAGRGVIIPPDSVHDLDTDVDTALCWADVHLSFFGIVPLTERLTVPLHLPASGIAALRESVRGMAALRARLPADGAAALRAIHAAQAAFVQSFLAVATWAPPAGHRDAALQRLAPLIQTMSSRLGDAWTRPTCARFARVGPTRLTALFLAATGLPPARFLARLRLQRAQELLVTGDETLTTLAARLGFHDAFHFSKRFKQHVGMAPAHYRRAYRRHHHGAGGDDAAGPHHVPPTMATV